MACFNTVFIYLLIFAALLTTIYLGQRCSREGFQYLKSPDIKKPWDISNSYYDSCDCPFTYEDKYLPQIMKKPKYRYPNFNGFYNLYNTEEVYYEPTSAQLNYTTPIYPAYRYF